MLLCCSEKGCKKKAVLIHSHGNLYHGGSLNLLVNDDLHMNRDLFVASGSDPVNTFQAV